MAVLAQDGSDPGSGPIPLTTHFQAIQPAKLQCQSRFRGRDSGHRADSRVASIHPDSQPERSRRMAQRMLDGSRPGGSRYRPPARENDRQYWWTAPKVCRTRWGSWTWLAHRRISASHWLQMAVTCRSSLQPSLILVPLAIG